MTWTYICLSLAVETRIIIQILIGSDENIISKTKSNQIKTVKTKNKLTKRNTKPITAKLKLENMF